MRTVLTGFLGLALLAVSCAGETDSPSRTEADGRPRGRKAAKARAAENESGLRESTDILAREPVTEQAEVLHVLIGWKRLAKAYGGKMDERAKQRSRVEADELASGILDRARDGEDFAALMKEYSEDWASAEKGTGYTATPTASLVPPFRAIALRLEPDEVGIVQTVYGWHIVKRIE
jgi:parvulin-like peptidyl-prolyl isomerase